jgi:hypothetical protein
MLFRTQKKNYRKSEKEKIDLSEIIYLTHLIRLIDFHKSNVICRRLEFDSCSCRLATVGHLPLPQQTLPLISLLPQNLITIYLSQTFVQRETRRQ